MTDDESASPEDLAAQLVELLGPPPDMTMNPELAAMLAELDAALAGLTGEARRKQAAKIRIRGKHVISPVPELPADTP